MDRTQPTIGPVVSTRGVLQPTLTLNHEVVLVLPGLEQSQLPAVLHYHRWVVDAKVRLLEHAQPRLVDHETCIRTQIVVAGVTIVARARDASAAEHQRTITADGVADVDDPHALLVVAAEILERRTRGQIHRVVV